jgi:hypothetical protein
MARPPIFWTCPPLIVAIALCRGGAVDHHAARDALWAMSCMEGLHDKGDPSRDPATPRERESAGSTLRHQPAHTPGFGRQSWQQDELTTPCLSPSFSSPRS